MTMNVLDYLLKANLYAGLFAGCYWLLLRRHTFFGVNRAYLLASVMLSLTLPLASLPTQTLNALPDTLTAPVGVIALPAVTISATVPGNLAMSTTDSLPVAAGFDWSVLASWLYGTVAMLLLMRLVWHVTRLLRIINASARKQHDGYVLVQPNNANTSTFSFFRYLVINPADANNDLILQHELVHIRQHHSADVITLATLRAVFWACPALWLLERALREVHEFLADRVAIRQVTDQPARQGVEQYARFLVEYAFGVRPDVLTNGFFNPSLLKRRIQMMQQRATNRWALGKYALVLPLAFALLAMTTAREEITAVFAKTITITGRVTNAADGKPLAGANIVVKGTTKGTTTTMDGHYKLDGLLPAQLVAVSFIGFATQEVKIAGRTTIDVALQPTPKELNKILVVGYASEISPTSLTADPPGSFTTKTGDVFTVVEQNPEFPGGPAALAQYLVRNLRYPAKAQKNNITGTVLIRFTVAEDGSVSDAYVEKGIGGGCNEEALRIVSQMPNWRPGKQNSKPIAVPYVLPIEFEVEKIDKRSGYNEPTFKPLDSPIGDFPVMNTGDRILFGNVNSSPLPVFDALKILSPSDTLPNSTGTFLRPKTVIRLRNNVPLSDDQQPLYILDSLEINNDDFKKINPNTIQSVEVLKNASAKAIYGEKAKNGVVIITTKKP